MPIPHHLRRRRGGYLTVIVLTGLIGGLAMGAVAGARRTQSAFPDYLGASNASQLQASTNSADQGATDQYSTAQAAAIARLPPVVPVAAPPRSSSSHSMPTARPTNLQPSRTTSCPLSAV